MEVSEGKVELNSTGDEKQVTVWDENDNILYEGPLLENYAEELPPKAVKLLDTLESIQLDTHEDHIEVELHTDHVEPVTMLIGSEE